MADHGEQGEGEHHQRDMAVPAVPTPGLVVIQAEFVLRRLERVLDRPAPSLDLDQSFQLRAVPTPSREVSQFAIGGMTPDQQTACPQAQAGRGSDVLRIIVSQFQVGPVEQARTLGALTLRQAYPVGTSVKVVEIGRWSGASSVRPPLLREAV